jgi:hypothetical protein
MPGGPKDEKGPADVIGAAVMGAKIATGEMEDVKSKAPNRAKGGASTKPTVFRPRWLPG